MPNQALAIYKQIYFNSPGQRSIMSDSDSFKTRQVNMNEFTRTALSLQIMFGSRRFLLLLVLLVAGGVAGYFGIRHWMSPARPTAEADRLWDEDRNVEAVRMYKDLLNKRDLVNPEFALVPREDRLRMYRRIITHETRYGTKQDARDWITRAWQEGVNFEKADFEHDEVFALWQEVVAPFREGRDKQRDLGNEVNR